MRKSFPLTDPKGRHKPARVVEQIKSDVRKYLKRENGKKLPEDADFWDFDCRTGRDSDSAEKAHVSELTSAVDTAQKKNWPEVYVEILAKPGKRLKKGEPKPDPS